MKLATLSLSALVLAAAQSSKPAGIASDWYQFRGPNRDGISPDTGLLKEWPGGGPTLAWKATGVGVGYSSVSIFGNRLYTMGDAGGKCSVLCINVADGKIVWTSPVGAAGGHNDYPGPRCTPATDGKMVYALTQNGDLVGLNAANGKPVWSTSLEGGLGGRMMSGWRWSESPLLDGNLVVCTPGGSKGTVAALNKMTGQPVWRSAEIKDSAAYASLVPVEIGKVRQYIVFTDQSVAGIAAANGKMAWRIDRKGETAVVPTPVYGDGMVFVTSGYGVGHNGFKVSGAGGKFSVAPAYSGKEMRNHHGGVVLVDGHVYGFDEGTLKCIELKTGKELWAERSVGKGAVAYAEGHLYCRSEGGPIALAEVSPAGYKEKGRFNQPDRSGKQAWPHPVVFGGKLYIRDQDVLLCYDVKAK